MTIHIDALRFHAIIGLLDFEREHTQPVSIDLKAKYSYADNQFIDYADLAALIEEKIKQSRYELLEEALLELETLILASYPQITYLYLKISKPDILKNCTVALSQEWEY